MTLCPELEEVTTLLKKSLHPESQTDQLVFQGGLDQEYDLATQKREVVRGKLQVYLEEVRT